MTKVEMLVTVKFLDREQPCGTSGSRRRVISTGKATAATAPTRPEVRMEQDRQLPDPEPLDQPVQPGHMVEVPMAEHDRLERVRRDAQPVEVLDQTERADTSVIQDTMHPSTPVHIDQRRVAVLGAQEIQRRPADRHAAGCDRQRPAGTRQPPTAHRPPSGSSMSAVLSTRVVTTTRSTGARSRTVTAEPST
jgi:hypothetical protein